VGAFLSVFFVDFWLMVSIVDRGRIIQMGSISNLLDKQVESTNMIHRLL
jgi:hypothetical protein